MKRRRVLLDVDAKTDLRHLRSWIVLQGAPEAATRYVGKIMTFARSLDLAAERGRDLSEIRAGLRAIPFESVVLAALVEDDAVVVLRIFHGSQDWLKQLRDQFGPPED